MGGREGGWVGGREGEIDGWREGRKDGEEEKKEEKGRKGKVQRTVLICTHELVKHKRMSQISVP